MFSSFLLLLCFNLRPVKFPGAAHFTLRCGCSNNSENDSHRNRSNSNYGRSDDKVQNHNERNDRNNRANKANIDIKLDQYQLPVVALSFNFTQPNKNNIMNNIISTLSLSDVETLHHEWGHALHSLLSRTTFQHLSGTRGPTDFVEVWLGYGALLSFELIIIY